MLILLWACSSPENEKNVEERLFSNCPIETAEEQLIDVGEVSLNVFMDRHKLFFTDFWSSPRWQSQDELV